jgi:hypothetical protein
MSTPLEPTDLNDAFVKMPEEWDKGASIDSGHALDFDGAMQGFLEDGGRMPGPPSVAPVADLADVATQVPPISDPTVEQTDPLHPGAEVWNALEQVVEVEEKEKLHTSHLHRLVKPEELPDISNL